MTLSIIAGLLEAVLLFVIPINVIMLNYIISYNVVEDPIEKFSIENSKKFFRDLNNIRYLRYGHIERNGNHFRYYFRLSRLYHDKKENIENWLKKIKAGYQNMEPQANHQLGTGFFQKSFCC